MPPSTRTTCWSSCSSNTCRTRPRARSTTTSWSRRGAVILPHGVLFRGGAEAAIRKEIVTRGYIKGIIGLPANLFFGTGIPASGTP
ncbi:MAG TPA: N-6 DNA methylase [Polyangiaceae bacterium]|nr:N-6 DNA methylase [Polyangiaceae bacterium]